MKPSKWVCLLSFAAILPQAVLSQSTFGLKNYAAGSLDAPVFDSLGNRLSGTNYLAMLYGSSFMDSLQPAKVVYTSITVAPVPFTYMPNGQAGYFAYEFGAVTVDTIIPGGVAWLQVRAWDARLGATYEDVLNLGFGGFGESDLFQRQGGDPTGLPSPASLLIGLQSFSLREVVPEPSTWTLLTLGGAALRWLSRRRTFQNTISFQGNLKRTPAS